MPESIATTFSAKSFLSENSLARSESEFTIDKNAMKHIVPHPNPIKISYGDPCYEFFPIHSLDVSVKENPFDSTPSSSFLTERVMPDEKKLELKKAMNYFWTAGHKSLIGFVKEFISNVHPPAYQDWDVILTNGAGNGLNKAVETLVSKGETVLVEEYTFSPFLNHVKNVGGFAVGVKLNLQKEGIDYDFLKTLLENWDTIHPDKKKPKCLYTIPTGQNPSGVSQSLELRKKIYALADEHDFMIIEDDPYGYISLPPYADVKSGKIDVENITKEQYLKSLSPSYLTIDTNGRVLRVETFSKVFAPGLRLGFIVAHKDITESIGVFSGIATGSPSGTSQTLVNNTIQHLGGFEGWVQWLIKLTKVYISRRNTMLDTLYDSTAYKKNQITVVDPAAGMFVIVIINLGTDKVSQYRELMQQLVYRTVENGVQIVIGQNMQADKTLGDERCNFVRLTIAAAANEEELIEATNRFTKSVSEVFEKLE